MVNRGNERMLKIFSVTDPPHLIEYCQFDKWDRSDNTKIQYNGVIDLVDILEENDFIFFCYLVRCIQRRNVYIGTWDNICDICKCDNMRKVKESVRRMEKEGVLLLRNIGDGGNRSKYKMIMFSPIVAWRGSYVLKYKYINWWVVSRNTTC